jgi:hypothetical protein
VPECRRQRTSRETAIVEQVVSDLPPVNRTSGSMLLRFFSPEDALWLRTGMRDPLLTNLQLLRLIPKTGVPHRNRFCKELRERREDRLRIDL